MRLIHATHRYPAGHVFFETGTAGTSAHIIISGQIEISLEQDGNKTVLGTFGPGEIFGEMALLGAQARTASATATEITEVINISRAHLLSLLKNSDPILRSLVLSLVSRLKRTNALISGSPQPVPEPKPREASDYSEERQRLEALVNQLDLSGDPQMRWVYRASKHIEESGKRLGIFSGSFNPLTVAHIKIIEIAQKKYGLDEILLILAKANVDKDVSGLSLADRLLMLKEYATSREDFSVAASSHGKFVEKIDVLKPEYPPRTQFGFIIGYDTLTRIFDPKYYTELHTALETLFNHCRIIVANRKGDNAEAVRKFMALPDCSRYAKRIGLIELPDFYASISSTDIRTAIEQGNSIDRLVPPEIIDFLETINAFQA